MNQQRGRRFRSAKDAEDARKKAAAKGEVLPDDPFDSNCITPGTVFMAELSKQLRYFINKKVSEDKDWQGVEIVLSGHEVCVSYSWTNVRFPGKENIRLWNIFDMQRYRSQENYLNVGATGLRCKYSSLSIRFRCGPYYAWITFP